MKFTPGLWKVFGGTVELENTAQKIDYVDVDIVVHDTTSRDDQNKEVALYFTDLQFQPGSQKTGWIPGIGIRPDTKETVGEFLDRVEFNVDEWRNYKNADGTINTSYHWKTVQPTTYDGAGLGYKRFYNLIGRGHEVITLPNDLPEPEFWALGKLRTGLTEPVEILSTGIDFTLIPKDDFDLCRISTDVGSVLPEDQWIYKSKIDKYKELNPNATDDLANHPLHTRYTREFWFDAGHEDDVLEVLATTMTARKNGTAITRNGVREITINGDTMEIYKNKFQLMPRGSVRFRIEFYKTVPTDFVIGKDSTTNKPIYETTNILQDTGIGFSGYAKFLQWTYGVERL
jgi:hypothetical protein